jgi:cytochrome c
VIAATVPANPNIAPPGYYMVFIINSSGVPSVAKMVQITPNSVIDNTNPLDGSYYNFFASHSDKIMEVSGASMSEGAPIVQGDINEGASQNFILALTGFPGAQQYQLMASHTNKCLEPAGGSTADLAQIVQNTCTAQPSQLWTFQPVANVLGGYRIVNVQSNKCMDVSGNSLGNGGQVIQFTCHGGANQTWKTRRR